MKVSAGILVFFRGGKLLQLPSTLQIPATSINFSVAVSQVWVKVIEVREEPNGAKVNCSMKVVDQESGKDLDPENTQGRFTGGFGGGGGGGGGPPRGEAFGGPQSDEPPEVGSIHQASVRSVKPFGLFVQLPGFRANGLVHLSQVGRRGTGFSGGVGSEREKGS